MTEEQIAGFESFKDGFYALLITAGAVAIILITIGCIQWRNALRKKDE